MLGIDDLRQSAVWNPSVSSIAVHPVELGRISARRLLHALGEAECGDSLAPPAPVLSARESCGCVPAP